MVYYIFPRRNKKNGKVYIYDSVAIYKKQALKYGDIVNSISYLCGYPKQKILECGAWFKSPQSTDWMPITTQDMLLVINDLVYIGWPQHLKVREVIYDAFIQAKQNNSNARGNIVLNCSFKEMSESDYSKNK